MRATERALQRAIVVALGVVACLVVFLEGPASASAAGGVPIDIGAGFTTTPSGPLFTLTNVAPGDSAASVIGVRNLSNAVAAIDLQLINVQNDENGCTKSEALVDTTCGDPGVGEGELASALVFTIAESDAKAGPFTQTWTGSAATLVSAATDIAASIPATSDRWLQITITLPGGAGNGTQSDTFDFGLSIVLSGLGSIVVPGAVATSPSTSVPASGTSTTPTTPTQSISNAGSGTSSSHGVGGASTGRSGGSTGRIGQAAGGQGLASTGVNVALLTMIGALLILCGFLLLQRRRGAREH